MTNKRLNSPEVAAALEDSAFGPIECVRRLFAIHSFLSGAVPLTAIKTSGMDTILSVSEYGKELLSSWENELSASDKAFIALDVFFYNNILIDAEKSDFQALKSYISALIEENKIFLPNRFGLDLYNRFNEDLDFGNPTHLDFDQTTKLLKGFQQGAYQVGNLVGGPLGLIESSEVRFAPPTTSVPLWHCPDSGCRQVHTVRLLGADNNPLHYADDFRRHLKAKLGPPSIWNYSMCRLFQREDVDRGRLYYDLSSAIADTMTDNDLKLLIASVLRSDSGRPIREALSTRQDTKSLANKAPDQIAQSISISVARQCLMLITDDEVIVHLDRLIRNQEIHIPPAEKRSARFKPPRISQRDAATSLSNLGVRADSPNPARQISALIWESYNRTNSLPELGWRCSRTRRSPSRSAVIDFIHAFGARRAVEDLILPSADTTLFICEKLKLDLNTVSQTESDMAEAILWKAGFNVPRYDFRIARAMSLINSFYELCVSKTGKLSDGERDTIRSVGVNLFVDMERFIEEFVSYNVWLLSEDHFINTSFTYTYFDALKAVNGALDDRISNDLPKWNASGGNMLGTLLSYASALSKWLGELPEKSRKPLQRPAAQMPHFSDSSERLFPFKHTALWADIATEEIESYCNKIRAIVAQLEQSKIAEVRNGIDHYREPDKFPDPGIMIECASRLKLFVTLIDDGRFFPKNFWLKSKLISEFSTEVMIIEDYHGRTLEVLRPQITIGAKEVDFDAPVMVPPGNLLGTSSPDPLFRIRERTDFSVMWSNYPKRTPSNGG